MAWWVPALGYLALVVALLVVGVQISIRAQLGLVLLSAAVVLAFSLWIILQGRRGGRQPLARSRSTRPRSPASACSTACCTASTCSSGSSPPRTSPRRRSDPKRDVPRAVLWSLLIVGGYFLVTSYAQAVGFGLDATAWKESVFPLQALASGDEFGSTWFGNLVAVIIILDVLAVCIGVGVAATRGHARHGAPGPAAARR